MQEWDLIEISEETFRELMEGMDVVAEVGEPLDEGDIIVTHYFEKFNEAYLGTLRVTEDGAIYLIPDRTDEPHTGSELYRKFYDS